MPAQLRKTTTTFASRAHNRPEREQKRAQDKAQAEMSRARRRRRRKRRRRKRRHRRRRRRFSLSHDAVVFFGLRESHTVFNDLFFCVLFVDDDAL